MMAIAETKKIGGVVLAAGESRRMGEQKLLLPYRETTLIKWVLKQALDSSLDEVVLVLGHRANRIIETLEDIKTNYPEKLRIAINKDYKLGMSSSLKLGFELLKDKFMHIMVILGDMPCISSSIIDELIEGYLKSNLPLGAISHSGRRAHPVIISSRFYPLIQSLSGDTGARSIFENNEGYVCLVKPSLRYSPMDIDTLEDYQKAILHYQKDNDENAIIKKFQ